MLRLIVQTKRKYKRKEKKDEAAEESESGEESKSGKTHKEDEKNSKIVKLRQVKTIAQIPIATKTAKYLFLVTPTKRWIRRKLRKKSGSNS